MKLLSLLVLSFILISCEGEKGGASSEAESTPVSKTLGAEDITDEQIKEINLIDNKVADKILKLFKK